MKKFFNNPYEFSFKDVLAIAFSTAFLIITFQSTKSKDALEVLKTLIPLLSIILGGYFGQEMVSAYFLSKNPYPPNYFGGYYSNYYGGYSIPYSPLPSSQSQLTEEEIQQSQTGGQPPI